MTQSAGQSPTVNANTVDTAHTGNTQLEGIQIKCASKQRQEYACLHGYTALSAVISDYSILQ